MGLQKKGPACLNEVVVVAMDMIQTLIFQAIRMISGIFFVLEVTDTTAGAEWLNSIAFFG